MMRDSVSDPHKDMPPGSAWTDADPDPGSKSRKCSGSLGEYRTKNTKARILL